MTNVIHGEIWSEDFGELNQLIANFSSCVRYSFVRFQKDNLVFNDVRKSAKAMYPSLNTRQISDAVQQAQGLYSRVKDKKVVFGGRKNWNDYKAGLITKQQFSDRKNNQIYLRGDATKTGNLNARITENKLRITVGKRKWFLCNLFIPEKYKQQIQDLIKSGIAYNIRLIRKDETHYYVNVDYQSEDIVQSFGFENGAIGVDINLDRIATADVSPDGNLIETKTLVNNRLQFASSDKRDYDIHILVKKIADEAIRLQKGIVFENLKFRKDFQQYQNKWNRKKSNFIWRKFITALEAKCIKEGIPYCKINPAYTSFIGKVKYMRMHNISIHESAAYVIGRRGLGFNEKISLYKFSSTLLKNVLLESLAEKYSKKRIHNWVWWKTLKSSLTATRTRMSDLQESDVNVRSEGENPSGKILYGQLLNRGRDISKNDEIHSSIIGYNFLQL